MSPFIPAGFTPPTPLATAEFRLEPLGPEHSESDYLAWTSSIEHIRATPGFPYGGWPPFDGISAQDNLEDLGRHREDHQALREFTYSVLVGDQVVGCVYFFPPEKPGFDVSVQSWVRADRAELDGPLADAILEWIMESWPWGKPDRYGR